MDEKALKRRQAEDIIWEVLFYIGIFPLVSRAFLHTTQMQFLWNGFFHGKFISYTLWAELLAATVVLAKSIRQGRFSVWETLLVVGSLIAFGRSSQMTGYEELPGILILLIGAKHVPAKRLAAYFFVLFTVWTCFTLYECRQGVFANWEFPGAYGRIKQSMGFLYPNEFAAHVFFLFLMWALLRGGKITFVEIAFMGFLTYLVWTKAYARTFLLSSAALMIVLLCAKMAHHVKGAGKFFRSYFVGGILLIIPLAVAGAALYLAWAFEPNEDWMLKLNELLSSRLLLGHMGLRDYGINLFGQQMNMVGASYRGDVSGYNFLDCSYVNILIRYGLAPLVMTVALYLTQGVRAVKRRDSLYLAILCLVAAQGFMEHHLVDFAYHPFFLLTLAAWPVKKEKEEEAEELEADELFPEEKVKEPEEVPEVVAEVAPEAPVVEEVEVPAEVSAEENKEEGILRLASLAQDDTAQDNGAQDDTTEETPEELAAEAAEEQAAEAELVKELQEALQEEERS